MMNMTPPLTPYEMQKAKEQGLKLPAMRKANRAERRRAKANKRKQNKAA